MRIELGSTSCSAEAIVWYIHTDSSLLVFIFGFFLLVFFIKQAAPAASREPLFDDTRAGGSLLVLLLCFPSLPPFPLNRHFFITCVRFCFFLLPPPLLIGIFASLVLDCFFINKQAFSCVAVLLLAGSTCEAFFVFSPPVRPPVASRAISAAAAAANVVRANVVVPQKMAVSHAAAEEISNVEDVSFVFAMIPTGGWLWLRFGK